MQGAAVVKAGRKGAAGAEAAHPTDAGTPADAATAQAAAVGQGCGVVAEPEDAAAAAEAHLGAIAAQPQRHVAGLHAPAALIGRAAQLLGQVEAPVETGPAEGQGAVKIEIKAGQLAVERDLGGGADRDHTAARVAGPVPIDHWQVSGQQGTAAAELAVDLQVSGTGGIEGRAPRQRQLVEVGPGRQPTARGPSPMPLLAEDQAQVEAPQVDAHGRAAQLRAAVGDRHHQLINSDAAAIAQQHCLVGLALQHQIAFEAEGLADAQAHAAPQARFIGRRGQVDQAGGGGDLPLQRLPPAADTDIEPLGAEADAAQAGESQVAAALEGVALLRWRDAAATGRIKALEHQGAAAVREAGPQRPQVEGAAQARQAQLEAAAAATRAAAAGRHRRGAGPYADVAREVAQAGDIERDAAQIDRLAARAVGKAQRGGAVGPRAHGLVDGTPQGVDRQLGLGRRE